MLTTDTLIWMILSGTTVVCVLSMLGVFASVMRHQTDLHNLRNRVAELQYRYTLQLARLHGHIEAEAEEIEVAEVDILDDQGNPIAQEAVLMPAQAAA
jgi:hypothetical protein